MQLTMSQRFSRVLPLLLNVPMFEGIRIHPGNTSADTEGCILVGWGKGTDQITQSRDAFASLFSKLRGAEAWRAHHHRSEEPMTPQTLLAAIVFGSPPLIGAGWCGYGLGSDRELATQAREDRAAALATESAASAAAHAISQIEVRNVTIKASC